MSRTFLSPLFCLLGVLSLPSLVVAQQGLPPSKAELSSWLEQARQLEPRQPSRADLQAAKSDLAFRIQQTRSFLGHGSIGLGWVRYLHLDQLQQQAETLTIPADAVAWDLSLKLPKEALEFGDEMEDLPDFEAFDQDFDGDFDEATLAEQEATEHETMLSQIQGIEQLFGHLIGNHPGLEFDALMRLRASVRKLLLLGRLYCDPEMSRVFVSPKSKLVSVLEFAVFGQDNDRELWQRDAWSSISSLDEFDQAPQLVSQMKDRWSSPNVRIRISKPALEAVTRREVYEVEPIRDCSDGRLITGQAIAQGTARMIPIGGQGATCAIVFDGSIFSTLNGSEGPVSFGLAGTTRLSVSQSIRLAADRFTTFQPQTSSDTNLRIQRVATKRNGIGSKLIRKIATNQINKQRPEATQDLDEQSVEEFLSKFVEDVQKEIDDAENSFVSDVRAPLSRFDLLPDDFDFQGDTKAMTIKMTLDGGFGMGAPTWLSGVASSFDWQPTSVTNDFEFRIHETAMNRLAQRMLGGEKISDFQALAESLGQEISQDALESLPEDISIEFDRLSPVSVRLDNNVIEITIRGVNYEIGGADLAAMNARVRYRIAAVDGKLVLTLDGDPEVLKPESGGAIKFLAQKNVLEKRLQTDLPKTQEIDAPELPSPADRLGRLHFSSATASDGWLVLEIRGDRVTEVPRITKIATR